MADDNKPANADAQNEQKKKPPLKTAIVLLAALLIEGIAISAVFIFAKGPEPIKADATISEELVDQEKEVEVLVIQDKFQNTRTGRSYLYDTEIYVIVRKKHMERVEINIESMKAQLNTEVATIFRRAEPSYLMEPDLATLTRQVSAVLTEKLGVDTEGEPYVLGTLIEKCLRIRADM